MNLTLLFQSNKNMKTFSIILSLGLSLPVSLLTNKPLFAQSVSPYDMTPSDDLNLNNNSNSNTNIPPLPTKQITEDVINVKGTPTPPSPTSTGKGIVSNKNLPTPPNLSEPYRKEQPDNTLVISDPYNNSQHNSGIEINAPLNNTSKVPTVTPSSNSSNRIQSQPKPISSSVTPSYGNSNQKRRSLADILIIAPGTSNSTPKSFSSQNSQNSNYKTTAYTSSQSNVHKVLVDVRNNAQETTVKSLYPDAFRTTYNGRSMLQVGVFSTESRANEVLQSLRNVGLNPTIIR